jgi:3-dehydroquinate dehydratase/shikimate dehydrogenase
MMKLCLSILPHSSEELLILLVREECRQADLIEIRCDGMSVTQWRESNISALRSMVGCPLIITVRAHDEGGVHDLSVQERIEIYQLWMIAGCEWIDVELAHHASILPSLPLSDTTKLLLSYHSSSADMYRLQTMLKGMIEEQPDAVKLICTAHDIQDGIKIIPLIHLCQVHGIPYIIHAMGEHGKSSRFLGAIHGNAWTYCALEYGNTTATGQITLGEARAIYGLHLLERSIHSTQQRPHLFGLLAYPTSHSKGIYVHNALMRKHNVYGMYINFTAPNADTFLNTWQPYLHGLSVSIPHKECVIEHVGFADSVVYSAQSANTLLRKDREFHAYNTDVFAIRDLLLPHRNFLDHVLVAGAGGTAKSVVTALIECGAKRIGICARNRQKAEVFVQMFSSVAYIVDDDTEYMVESAPQCYINTTSVGMTGTSNAKDLPPGAKYLRPSMLVFDVVYNPRRTPLLVHGEELGCTTLSGEKMFLLQAWYQFKLFTGKDIPFEDVVDVWQEIHTQFFMEDVF